MSTSSLLGAVRGGGRMYIDSPLAGYTEEEMVAEARNRQAHNRQRRRMKQLLSAATEDGATVATRDLLLAAKLAKMELPAEMIADTPYAVRTDSVGVPMQIAYKPFYTSLPAPALRGPGGFGDLPPLKSKLAKQAGVVTAGSAAAADMKAAVAAKSGPTDEDVEYWFKIMQEKMTTRFSELRRAFRALDEDASGNLDRAEFKGVLTMFNLGIPDDVVEKLIDLADFDGDGSINYAEFARIFTAENVLDMKKTLSAVETDGSYAAKMRYKMQHGGDKSIDKETGENVRLRRTGPGLAKMRKAHKTLRTLILQRYATLKEAFRAIDTDNSGLARRAEIRTFLGRLSKSIPDGVISGLISYVDTDGDTKTLSEKEFITMMGEAFLDDVAVNPPER